MQQHQADGYFLSSRNSTATIDQRDLEALALQMMQSPAIAKAAEVARGRWKMMGGADAPQEAWARFDQFIEEWTFNYVLKAVNSDANYPRVLGHVFGPPHEWFGKKVPGSRPGGGDNPDNNYVVIPVDAYARFELHGQRGHPEVVDTPIMLCGDISLGMVLGAIDWQDVKVGSDGGFVITLDPQPANGRSNHIQTKPDARYLFIRDTRSDWRQQPARYRIRRLDPPVAPPLTLEHMTERAAQYIAYDVASIYLLMRMHGQIPENTCMAPFNTGAVGGVSTQRMSFGRVKLAADEALIVNSTSANARYFSMVLCDYWLYSFDVWKHCSTLNNAQSVTNADGSTTYVISRTDPGVHNWLDTAGLHLVAFMHRWQVLPREGDIEPTIKCELVKLNALDSVLPKDCKRVNAAERKQQMALRDEMFKTRYLEN